MNEFQTVFKIGDQGFNRLGVYAVQSFDTDGMWVRYEDGCLKHLSNFDMQMRIIDNMILEYDAFLEQRDWQRGFTREEEDTDALIQEAEDLLVPQLTALIDRDSKYDILRQASQEVSGECSVYAILLSQLSRQMRWGFHAFGHQGMPCIYVGQSWFDPDDRFAMHKAGEHSSYYVRRFGLGLLPGIHQYFHSLSRDVALMAEAALADALGELGCTVFGGH